MKQISVSQFEKILKEESQNSAIDFINVCSPSEYDEKHIVGVRNIPLDTITEHISELNSKKRIYIHCYSGSRGQQAIQKLESLGVTAELINIEGGLMAWEGAGLATTTNTQRIPVMRQVFIAAGTLILLGIVLTHFINYNFIIIPILISCGLIVSGTTGWCGMALLLNKMPWNK